MKKPCRCFTARKQWDYCSCAPKHICADTSLAVTEWTLKTKLYQKSSPHPHFVVVSPKYASGIKAERAEGCGDRDLPMPCASRVSWKQGSLHPGPHPQLQKAGWVTPVAGCTSQMHTEEMISHQQYELKNNQTSEVWNFFDFCNEHIIKSWSH